VRDLTGNVPGEAAILPAIELARLDRAAASAALHRPARGVQVFWGYGLFVDKPGNFVAKPMAECSGREIMTEIIGHLGAAATDELLEGTRCIPCMMPFITSQFLRREHGDRPQVIPNGWANLAFTGQYCEQPDDVVSPSNIRCAPRRRPPIVCSASTANRRRSSRASMIHACCSTPSARCMISMPDDRGDVLAPLILSALARAPRLGLGGGRGARRTTFDGSKITESGLMPRT
jgi:hypothetical protein